MKSYSVNYDPGPQIADGRVLAKSVDVMGSIKPRIVCRPDLFPQSRKWAQFRFPRSKKKRIRRKWAKQRKNWKSIPVKNEGAMYFSPTNTFYVSPAVFDKLKNESVFDPQPSTPNP